MAEEPSPASFELGAPRRERREFVRTSWVNVIGNLAKIVVEGVVGLTFGSMALLADAAHSIADLVASVVVLVWGRVTYDEPDPGHPHGHDRIEPLSALFVGAVIVLLGLNLLYESARGVIGGTGVVFNVALLGAVGFALVDMLLVYTYTVHVNETLDSRTLEALAADSLNDVVTSVAVLVGIFGVMAGVPTLDPLAGGLVSLFVVHQGVQIGRENVDYLLGAAPSPTKRRMVIERLRDHPAVEGIHDLAIYYEGTSLEVEVHVEVDGSMTLLEAHDLETALADLVRGIEGVGDVHVHLDPSGIGEWKDAAEGTAG